MSRLKTKNLKKTNIFLNILTIIAIVFIGVSCDHDIEGGPVSYRVGTVIVKFTDESPLGLVADKLFADKKSFSTLTGDSYLDKLNKKFRVVKYSRVFTSSVNIEELKAKYPKRSARIPKNAEIPKLENIYRVIFEDYEADVNMICEEFNKSPEIQYANPEYLAITTERVHAK